MKIPKHVKVGANMYAVVFTEGTGQDEQLGLTKAHLNRMEIAKSADGEKIPEASITDTFMHEVLHAISIVYGIGLREKQVAGLAGGLLQVIRDNGLDFRCK